MIDPMTSRLAHVQHQERLDAAAKARQYRATGVAESRLSDRMWQALGKQLIVLHQRMYRSTHLAKANR